MTGFQITMFAGAMLLTLLSPLIGSRRWFPHNRFGTIVLLLSGVAIGAMLWAGGLPPDWFSGSWEGFSIALTLMAMAFLYKTADEKFYVLPWLLGFGVTLLIANIRAHI